MGWLLAEDLDRTSGLLPSPNKDEIWFLQLPGSSGETVGA